MSYVMLVVLLLAGPVTSAPLGFIESAQCTNLLNRFSTTEYAFNEIVNAEDSVFVIKYDRKSSIGIPIDTVTKYCAVDKGVVFVSADENDARKFLNNGDY